MEDREIVDLFWARNEQALRETADKYRSYCLQISLNILGDLPDSEENVNDTYLKAWASIPPNRPVSLKAYLAKIARNLALNKYNSLRAQKRRASLFTESADELDICAPSGLTAEDEAERRRLGKCISDFLYRQSAEARKVFVCRYFYCEDIGTVASRFGFSQSKVKSMLLRTRTKLRAHLQKEGYFEE